MSSTSACWISTAAGGPRPTPHPARRPPARTTRGTTRRRRGTGRGTPRSPSTFGMRMPVSPICSHSTMSSPIARCSVVKNRKRAAALAAAQHLEHAVDVRLHALVAAALAARREHRLAPGLDPAEVVGEQERGAGDRVVAVAAVALLDVDPAALDDVEDAGLQLGGGLGERFVDALGGLDRGLGLESQLALLGEVVAEPCGAHREPAGEPHAGEAQHDGEDVEHALGGHEESVPTPGRASALASRRRPEMAFAPSSSAQTKTPGSSSCDVAGGLLLLRGLTPSVQSNLAEPDSDTTPQLSLES